MVTLVKDWVFHFDLRDVARRKEDKSYLTYAEAFDDLFGDWCCDDLIEDAQAVLREISPWDEDDAMAL